MSNHALPARFGDYTLLRKIATGGMAEIFLANAHAMSGGDRHVALKMIHPRYAEEKHFHRMMVEEARIAVQLNHPNVGQVFDLGQWAGHYFLVMEFIDGCDLARAHEAANTLGQPIAVDVVGYIGHEVAAALAFAHQVKDKRGKPLGLIHRDISPQNVLLARDGQVKLIDFGIAKVATQIQQTQVGIIKGKFYYMSPEQAGAHDVDQRSDLFSLGICLWETLVGRPLFRRDDGPTNPLAILHEVRSMPIPRVRDLRPDCPPELDGIVARALARDVSVRFQTAESLREALARFLVPIARVQPATRLRDTIRVLLGDEQEAPAARPLDSKRRPVAPSGVVSQRMQREEFAPSDASVIFQLGAPPPHAEGVIDLDWLDPSTATRVFQREEFPSRIPRAADRRPPTGGAAGVPSPVPTAPVPPPRASGARSPAFSGRETGAFSPPPLPAVAPSAPPPAPHTAVPSYAPPALPYAQPAPPVAQAAPPYAQAAPPVAQAVSDDAEVFDENASTQFLRRDAILGALPSAGVRRNAPRPRVDETLQGHALGAAPDDDVNARTMAVDAGAIRAAHEAFAARLAEQSATAPADAPRAMASRATPAPFEGTQVVDLRGAAPPISSHELFRWLVVLGLVVVILSATLALLLVRRGHERDQLQADRERALRQVPQDPPTGSSPRSQPQP